MLVAGDELGRTQLGNNNAYAQDNELSWLDWDGADTDLLEFTQRLVRIRSDHRVFRRRHWFEDRLLHGEGVREIGWYRPDGTPMTDEDWQVSYAKSLAVFLNGGMIPGRGPHGEAVVDDSFLVLFNSGPSPCEFILPADLGSAESDAGWIVELVTSPSDGEGKIYLPGESVTADAWAVVLLRQPQAHAA